MALKSPSAGTSLLRRWDCRWKVCGLTVFIFSLASLEEGGPLAAAVIVAAVITALSGLTLQGLAAALKTPALILLMMVPLILLTPGDRMIWSWKIIRIYERGLRTSVLMTVKSLTIMSLFASLLHGSELPELVKALGALGIPKKMIAILLSTYRYLFLYTEDLKKLSAAAKLRGGSLRSSLSHGATSLDILLTLLIRSHEQSERMGAAMTLRGFGGAYHTDSSPRTRWWDPVMTFIVLVLSAGMVAGEFRC